MPQYIVKFANSHLDFRLPELKALAKLHGLDSSLLLHGEEEDTSPFLTITLGKDEDAILLASRSILIKEIIRVWAKGVDRADLTAQLSSTMASEVEPGNDRPLCSGQEHPPWIRYQGPNIRWKVEMDSFGSSGPLPVPQIVHSLTFLQHLAGPVDFKHPDVVLMYYAEYPLYHQPNNTSQEQRESGNSTDQHDRSTKMVAFGNLVARGGRGAIHTYDLKKRAYLGTTSMDPELSLIMSNQALVRPGSLVLDPFVGTGSFICTSTHFGGFALGSDIDGRQIRGTVKNARKEGGVAHGGVQVNVKQYGLQGRYLGAVVTDMSHHCWRRHAEGQRSAEFFDAIITDPPYGVRAGAKKIALPVDRPLPASAFKLDGTRRYPNTAEYEMGQVVVDLIHFAAQHLVPGGRLVFWLPTVNEGYHPLDIPTHPYLVLIANSQQDFGKWSRRLITMEKVSSDRSRDATSERVDDANITTSVNANPGHANFRHNYYRLAKDVPR